MSVRTLAAVTAGSPARIEVRNPAGSVTLEAVEGSDAFDVRVEALDAAAEQLLDGVEIVVSDADPDRPDSPVTLRIAVPERRLWRTPAFDVRVLTPAGAAARVAVASADVHLRGRFARTELTAASGDLAVDEAAELELRTASGNVRAGTVHGPASIGTASGEIRLGRAEGSLRARTASGDVAVERTDGATSISTASGDVTVGAAAGESVRVKTASGDVTVGVAPGLRVWLDLSSVSGRMQSGLADDGPAGEGPAQLSLTLRSVSGDLRVRMAAATPAA
jgi:hypothetical protein